MQRFTWDANGYPAFGQPIPAGIPITNPSGDDYTPALLQPVVIQTNGRPLVTARAPLPLLTNQWTVEYSPNLRTWSSLTNVPGLYFSAAVLDSAATSNRFYRVNSMR